MSRYRIYAYIVIGCFVGGVVGSGLTDLVPGLLGTGIGIACGAGVGLALASQASCRPRSLRPGRRQPGRGRR